MENKNTTIMVQVLTYLGYRITSQDDIFELYLKAGQEHGKETITNLYKEFSK